MGPAAPMPCPRTCDLVRTDRPRGGGTMIKLKAIAECSVQLEKGRLDGGSGLLFGLLAYFIAERGHPVARSTLAEYFWWNRDKREAGHCLRQAVYKLRRLGAPIETS